MFERIFSITAKLSDLLQAEHLNYAAAAACIRATKETIQSLRCEEWKKLWDEAVSMATNYNVAVESIQPRRNRQLPEQLEDTVITAETIGNRDAPVLDYRVQVYYHRRRNMYKVGGAKRKQHTKCARFCLTTPTFPSNHTHFRINEAV